VNIVFLFNSDHPSLGSYYGPPVRDRILGARVLQKAERHMRVCLGDILTYGAIAHSPTRTYKALIELCNAVYRPRGLDLLIRSRLEPTYDRATVYCWLFQNMTQAVAEELHATLLPDPAFLGTMDVSFSDPLHLHFFRNSLCEEYRLQGRRCSVFYSMGENYGPDIGVQDGFEKHGFNVSYEDSGARRTIFDDYDTVEHFRRVEDFKHTFAEFSHVDADIASDLALNLEELHPRLFDAFAAAARTLARAETEEDYAQAALSGRRVLERIADYLFPPREELWNGRMVGSNQYKNRLWAYIEKAVGVSDSTGKLNRLGKEADKLVALFNSGLHAEPTKEKVEGAFSTLGLWLSEVIELSPESARQPYLAYDEQLLDFVNDIL
jgi:hypothetical protein